MARLFLDKMVIKQKTWQNTKPKIDAITKTKRSNINNNKSEKNAWNLYGKAVPRQDDSLILGRLDGHALGRGGRKLEIQAELQEKKK